MSLPDRESYPKLDVDDVKDAVAHEYRVTRPVLSGMLRKAGDIRRRHAMYLCWRLTSLPLSEIGAEFGCSEGAVTNAVVETHGHLLAWSSEALAIANMVAVLQRKGTP